jgi:hypothetical protein
MSHLHHVLAALGRDGGAGDEAGDDLNLRQHVLAHNCERVLEFSRRASNRPGKRDSQPTTSSSYSSFIRQAAPRKLLGTWGIERARCQAGRGLVLQHSAHLESAEDRVKADFGVALEGRLVLDHAEHLAEDAGRLVRLVRRESSKGDISGQRWGQRACEDAPFRAASCRP